MVQIAALAAGSIKARRLFRLTRWAFSDHRSSQSDKAWKPSFTFSCPS
jgi:hypothetical protein